MSRIPTLCSITLCIALAACEDAPQAPTTEAVPSVPLAPSEPAKSTAPEAAKASDPCAVLNATDFEAVGLSQGNAKRESNMSDGGCTWDPVLGNGGFLHFEYLTGTSYEKRKDRAGAQAVAVSGIGDDAFSAKALTGHAIHVKKGAKFFRIDGNAQLTPEKLESLARAVVQRL